MSNFFHTIFGGITSLIASAIIAVGLVSVPEVPKNVLQIELSEKKSNETNIGQNTAKIKISATEDHNSKQQENEKQRDLPRSIIPKIKLEETQYKTILQEFVNNPTRASFLNLCSKANQIEMPNMNKSVLSPDRTTIITIPRTMFEVMKCEEVNDQNYNLIDITAELFQWDLKDDDSDRLRMNKIAYNNQMREMLASGKFVIVQNDRISGNPIMTPSINNLTGHLIIVNKELSFIIAVYNPMMRAMKVLENPDRFGVSGRFSFGYKWIHVIPSE